MHVRELPPQRLHVLATAPNGYTFRWGDDERRPENMPSGIGFSTIVPGGFEALECELPRKMELDYPDLRRLTTLTVIGPGGRIAAEGRLEKAPRATGDSQVVSPQAVGWQAHLADDEGAQEVYIDRDLGSWQDASLQRRMNIATGTFRLTGSWSTGDQNAGAAAPGIEHRWDRLVSTVTTARALAETWYYADNVPLSEIRYDFDAVANLGSADWFNAATLSSDDIYTSTDVGTDHNGADASSQSLTTTSTNRKYAILQSYYDNTVATDIEVVAQWKNIRVFGTHGLTKQGTVPNEGFFASDVVAHAIAKYAPRLRFTTGAAGTITPSSFVIPQLAFQDPTTADAILKAADRFHLRDWAVWEGKQPNQPTFYYQDRGARGRRWRARVRPSQLEETGPQVDRLFNAVYVKYSDAAGTAFTVGPTGSAANTTSASLIDTDPLNPLNQLGIKRHTTLDMGINSTAAAATEVGRRFLEEAKAHDKSGSAQLVGHVEDDRGVMQPSWAVRAGDEISFIDAADPSYRRIVRTSYEHDSRTNSIDLDSPPEGMESLLERLGVAIAGQTSGFFGSQGMGGDVTTGVTGPI